MTILFEIPLLAKSSDQTLDIVISDIPYSIRILWNERFGYFSLSISEKGGDPILTNIKMVANYPLVGSYKKFPFAGDLYFLHRGGKTYRPTYYDIGGESYGLYYYDSETPIDYPKPISPVT